MGLLDGKVAVITGAGGGLGRAHALAMAQEGANIVVNDLGGARDGTGASTTMADAVVEEIRNRGGHAVANYGSVAERSGAESMLKTALDKFGRVDIWVNNAGILRDRTLLKMEDAEFDLVMAVHARGTYLCTQVFAKYLREAGHGGRIINTSSYAGLIGNFGQSNYAMAKAGIAGFTRVCALELARMGVTVNAIAPLAHTRMTEDITAVPQDILPEHIAPFVVFLASDLASAVNGRIFGVHGPQIFEYRMLMTDGVTKNDGVWTPAEIAQNLKQIGELPHEKPVALPAAQGPGPQERVRALFLAMPQAFKAEKAGNWASTLHFDVKEAGDYSLVIDSGRCVAHDGKIGTANATVVFDSADTLLSMAAGSLKPEAAFMAGKIKADNMGELMKFSQFFSMKKAAEAAEGATKRTAPAPSPSELVAQVFENMQLAYVPERAGGWQAKILFQITGTGDWTVSVADGAVRSEKGAGNGATLTITFDGADTLLGMVAGKVKPESAFMAGKMKADNMAELMKFGQAFDLKRGAEAAKASPSQESARPEKKPGLNVAAVGKFYRGAAHFVKSDEFRSYALATDDPNPRYLSESGDQIAPPMFSVRPVMDAVGRCVTDPDVNADLLRLVHGEQDMTFHRLLRPWDLVYPVATFDAIEEKSSGQLMRVRQKLWVDGELVTEIVSGYFIRGENKGEGAKKPLSATESVPDERELVFSHSHTVSDDQPIRYAKVSLDNNPIHTDPKVARAAGHPNIILHGLCTMAFAATAIVDRYLNGDPTRLKRLKGRFSRIVLPGDVLTTVAWIESTSENAKILGVETKNQDGYVVFASGMAEVAH